MRALRWGAALSTALMVGVPLTAHATTTAPTSPPNTPSAPSPVQPVSQPSAPAPAPSTPSSPSAPAGTPTPAPTSQPATHTSTAPSSTPTSTSAPRTSTPTAQPKASSTHAAGTTTVTVPAPGATAEAYAAHIVGIISLSHTKASASGSGTSGTANVLELGEKPPASQFGGTLDGPGSQAGNLLDTGPNSNFRLQVAPWSVNNTQSTSTAIADLLLLNLGDPTTPSSASVDLLHSKSNASWTSAASSSNSTTDGAIVNLGGPGGLTVDLLHSETSSSGKGKSFLLSVNGNEIGSSDQTNGACVITIPGLLSLSCLSASGGPGSEISSVAGLNVPPTNSQLIAQLFNTSETSGPAGASLSSGGGSGGGTGGGNGGGAPAKLAAASSAAPAAAPKAAASSGKLAFTGINSIAMLAMALLLGVAGAVGVVWSRYGRRLTA